MIQSYLYYLLCIFLFAKKIALCASLAPVTAMFSEFLLIAGSIEYEHKRDLAPNLKPQT